ncbi:hypothetical protein BH11BAC2_BH11BAC2_26050 [soil metagenome]
MTDSAGTPASITDNWNAKKVKLKAQFSMLTEADLHFEVGKEAVMLNRIQIILGKTKYQLADIINAL